VQKIVGQDPHDKPGLSGCESMATRLGPAERVLPIFDLILDLPATVVHLDYLPGWELGIGHNQSDPWKQKPIISNYRQFNVARERAAQVFQLYEGKKDKARARLTATKYS